MSGSVRYCGACGSPAEGDAQFCPACGQAVAPAPLASVGPPQPPGMWVGATGTTSQPLRPATGPSDTRLGLLLLILSFAFGWIPYVSFVGGLLALIGIIFFWTGRREFSAQHQQNVLVGVVCVILAVTLVVAATVWFVAAAFSAAANSLTSSPQAVGASLQNGLYVLFASAVVASAFGSLGYVLLPYRLADRLTRELLWGAFALSVGFSALVSALLLPRVSAAIAQATSGTTINTGPITAVQNQDLLLSTLQAIPYLMFLLAYYRVRRRGPTEGEPSGPAFSPNADRGAAR